jgi:hypothetical protein
MLGEWHIGLCLLAALGLLGALARLRQRDAVAERLFAVAGLLTVATFLLSKSYWAQYNAHLAPTTAVLAGLGAALALRWGRARSRPLALFVTAVAGLACLSPLPAAIGSARQKHHGLLALADAIRAAVPPTAALCAFEPAWAVAAGRLPGIPQGAPVLVDPYGLMLHDALSGPARFTHAGAAFEDAQSQRAIRSLLERCDFLVLGGRGEWQLNAATEHWIQAHFTREGPLWRRTAQR